VITAWVGCQPYGAHSHGGSWPCVPNRAVSHPVNLGGRPRLVRGHQPQPRNQVRYLLPLPLLAARPCKWWSVQNNHLYIMVLWVRVLGRTYVFSAAVAGR